MPPCRYEQYLDSQITAKDVYYLEDVEVVRHLVELGCAQTCTKVQCCWRTRQCPGCMLLLVPDLSHQNSAWLQLSIAHLALPRALVATLHLHSHKAATLQAAGQWGGDQAGGL